MTPKQAFGPMGGGSGQPSDTSHREEDYCKTCGGRIYKVNDGSPDKYAWQHDIEQGAGVPHQAFPGGKAVMGAKTAYGDTKAPMDVDTLRESECPVCGNDDSWDGDRCQVCGFFRPPQMFMDPDTSIAGQMDLRQDIADQTGMPDPTMGADGETIGADPSQTNAGGGGLTLNPANPTDIQEDGIDGGVDPNDPMADVDQADPNGIAAADMQEAGNEALMPQALDPNGVDMGAADKHFNQGGEAFTPGPNAPTPEQPMDPANPEEIGEDGTDPLTPEEEQGAQPDGQQPAPPSDGEPGTPGDGVPDLVCPACGFQADGANPLSVGDSAMDPTAEPNGAIEGDACPQCGQAPLTPIGQVMV